jgi:pimeloyl-ACP methyl ester carboxylesterase
MAATGPSTQGALLLNPGGPGESGNLLLPVLAGALPAEVRSAFDLIGFDPRGTGASAPLRCGPAPARITAALPVPAHPGDPLPGTPVFTDLARSCAAAQPAETPTVSTIVTARDMDRIRQALGRERISFYGLSYGTALGAVYARLFPGHVRTMVLDGAVDVDATLGAQAAEQAPAAERSLLHLLHGCPARPRCTLGSDPVAAYRHLLASLTSHPLPAPGGGDAVPVTAGDLDTAALMALSVPGAEDAFLDALAAAGRGDGGPLRSLALTSVLEGDGSSLAGAQWATICNDAARHPSPTAAGRLARRLAASWPLLGAYAVTYNLGGCVAWPPARLPVTDLAVTAAPPVLVVGTTGDPNTPYAAAGHLSAAIARSSLLTWDGWGHTWLLSGPGNTCMQADVSRYLLDGAVPPAGTVCR